MEMMPTVHQWARPLLRIGMRKPTLTEPIAAVPGSWGRGNSLLFIDAEVVENAQGPDQLGGSLNRNVHWKSLAENSPPVNKHSKCALNCDSQGRVMKVESIQLSMRHCFEWSHHEWIVHIGVVSIDGKAFSKKTILLELSADQGRGEGQEIRGGPWVGHINVQKSAFVVADGLQIQAKLFLSATEEPAEE